MIALAADIINPTISKSTGSVPFINALDSENSGNTFDGTQLEVESQQDLMSVARASRKPPVNGGPGATHCQLQVNTVCLQHRNASLHLFLDMFLTPSFQSFI